MESQTNFPISHTKVVVPRRREEILTRSRLLEMMFEFLDKKLILVSAPAGYGKTSLLIDLVHHSELPTCWLSLDRLDQDPQRFAAYFIGALEEQFPNFGRQSKNILSTITSIQEGMETLVVTLVNDIYEHVPQHFILVVDDHHLIGDVPEIQSFLNRFIQLVDENCHIIISSRTLTQLPDLPLLVARDLVGGLDFSELAFRADEIQALFVQNYDIQISENSARELVDGTEGWITGLQLSGLGTVQGFPSRLQGAQAAGIDLFDYLGQQVLDQQIEDIRLFLLRSSLLEEFNSDLCNAVLSGLYIRQKNWDEYINTIVQNNLFTLPVGMDSGWVRYHHLFRDFLQERLEKERPDEIPIILKSLARAYEALGEWERAYYIQSRLEDVEALAELIERAAPNLMSHALTTMGNWVSRLPPSISAKRSGILSIRGVILYMKGNLEEGLELFNRAEQGFRKVDDSNGLALTLVRRATVHRYLGAYQKSLSDADEALAITEANDQMQIVNANALRQKGLCLFRQGQSRQAVKLFEDALEIYERINDTSHIPILMMETGMAYDAIGKEEKTKAFYDKALKIWKNEGNLIWQATLLNNLGVLQFNQGEYDRAILTLEEGLLCAKRSGQFQRVEALILFSLGDVYSEVEDFEFAHRHYEQGKKIAESFGDRFLLNYLGLAQARLALMQLDFNNAKRLLEKIGTNISAQSSFYEDGLYHMLFGHLSLHMANFTKAKELLAIAESHFRKDGRMLEWSKSQMLLAAAYYQCGDQNGTQNALKETLSVEQYSKHSLIVFVRHIQKWLNGFQNDTEYQDKLKKLFEESHQVHRSLPTIRRRIRRLSRAIEIPAVKLTIQAFGRTQVKVGKKVLTLSDWQTQSVRDLFFYFLTEKEPLTKEQIGEVLWPETENPSKLKMRFKNDIYRLRRAVGSETILFENEFYSFNRSLDFDYDVDAFEGLLAQIQQINDTDIQIELLQKAVNLINGHFLEDIGATWVWSKRERLDQEFLQAALILTDLLKNKNRLEEALSICKRAIEHVPTFEAAYESAMKLYMQMNDRVNAIRIFEQYKEMMRQELDLSPASELEAVYKTLLY